MRIPSHRIHLYLFTIPVLTEAY